MNSTILNSCPCNEPKTQCILRNVDYGHDRYLLLTDEQVRMVRYLFREDIIDSDIFVFTVLDSTDNFEKV